MAKMKYPIMKVIQTIELYEALNSISLLRKYISQSQNLGSGYEILDILKNIILNNRFIISKQTKITDFFKLQLILVKL